MPDPELPPASAAPRWRALGLRLGVSLVLAVAFARALSPWLDTLPEDLSIPAWVVPTYLLVLLPYHLFRAGRWHFLVGPLGASSPWRTSLVALAGYMWIALLPFRLGELARPLFLTQTSGVPVRASLGTVVLERVLDALVVCALFFAGALAHPELWGTPLWQACVGVMAAFGLALAVLLAMARFPRHAGRWSARLLAPVLPALAHKVQGLVEGLATGLGCVSSGRAVLGFGATTLGYWAANALGIWVLARGCGIAMTPGEALLVMSIMTLVLLVPGGPAQFGVFQTGVAVGLSLLLEPQALQRQGSTFAFYLYVCQLGSIVAVGLVAQRWLRLDWRQLWPRAPADLTPRDRGSDR